MIRVNISNNKNFAFYKDFPSQGEADAYIAEMKTTEHWGESDKDILVKAAVKDEQGNEISPAEFVHQAAEVFFTTEDITAQLDAEASAIETKKTLRAQRIAQLKALDFSTITTVAQVKAVVKIIAQEILKDEA